MKPIIVWFAYYSDWSGMAVFDNEVDALRHAVEHHMEVAGLHSGDVKEQIR